MVPIAAGTFEMGCPTDGPPGGCRPAHTVTLTHDYLIGVTEITIGEFKEVMGYETPRDEVPDEVPEGDEVGDDAPEGCVIWGESASFANAVSDAEGLPNCYTCSGAGSSIQCVESMNPYECTGYRLPTEAEWEKAARCDTDHTYSGSDDNLEVAWTLDNSELPDHYVTMKPVGTLAPNGCGTYDMSGNVYELVEDFESDFSSDPQTDPNVPRTGSPYHVIRGGGAYDYTVHSSVAYRMWSYAVPESSMPECERGVGFRLARTRPDGGGR